MVGFSSPENTPKPVFYPSLVCNFQLRFDEGKNTPVAKSVDDVSGGNAVATPTTPSTQPEATKKGTDGLSQLLGIVPYSCSVELPGYRQAGTFDIEMAFNDFPIDPRVIRAIGVSIHADTVSASKFAQGMLETALFNKNNTVSPGNRRSSIIETTPDNELLSGLVDNVVVEHTSSFSKVRLTGRDLRSIFLDTGLSPKTLSSLEIDKPIDQVIFQIANNLMPGSIGVPVKVNPSEWPGGIVPSPNTSSDATRANFDAAGQFVRAASSGESSSMNFWDLITQLCFFVGAVPYFAGSVLRIRPTRTLFDVRRQETNFDPAIGTPFRNSLPRTIRPPTAIKSESIAFRRITFGRDIARLSFERKLGGVKVPVVEVSSYNTNSSTRGTDRLLKVQHPPKTASSARATTVPPSGSADASQSEFIRIRVHGVTDKAKLENIAKAVYQEIGRQEIGGSIETKNLTSFGGDNQDPDLIRLRPGDPIEIRVDASGVGTFPPPISPLTDSEKRSFEQQVKVVYDKVGDQLLARALVESNRGDIARLARTFRVANVKFAWSKESGLQIAFDFQNFVEARYDVD